MVSDQRGRNERGESAKPAAARSSARSGVKERSLELLVVLVLAWALLFRWYFPRGAARACARHHGDPVAVLSDVPKWWWAVMDDCYLADVVVHACWDLPDSNTEWRRK